MFDTTAEDALPEYERPNKSQLKREMLALLELARKLAALREEQWLELALPESVVDALQSLRDMYQHGARKRQIKLIAKLLRGVDVTQAEEAVEVKTTKHSEANLAFHQVERWRDRLLGEGHVVLTEFLREYPDVDVQHIRHLLRNAAAEEKQGKSPKSSRLLFKFIKSVCD